MSIDFDSAALQTQHEEDEYDPEDYAREQELHKLLTDLPDDMLEDSREDSSPELDYSACSNRHSRNRQQRKWPQQTNWSDHNRQHRSSSHPENSEDNFVQGPYHDHEYSYEERVLEINSHANGPQSQPLPPSWPPLGQDYQSNHEGYRYGSVGVEQPGAGAGISTEEAYEHGPYPPRAGGPAGEYRGEEGQRDTQSHGGKSSVRQPFQNVEDTGSGNRRVDRYKVSYQPCQPSSQPSNQPSNQPKMYHSQSREEDGQFDQLQREFLDSAQNTADSQKLAQMEILNKAQVRQMEDLERNLEDSRRNMRYLEHQFAIVKDEKDGMTVTLKESGRLIEEAQDREAQLLSTVKSLEQKVHSLTERDHENMKKQRVSEAAVDSMQQQLLELGRSDTLSRTREKHERDVSAMREQHEAKVLLLQQKLDACSQALEEQTELTQRLREQVQQLERRREEEQVERAAVINTLTQRLEEGQLQCAKLLQTGSVQEMSQLQIKLQQAQSAKTLCENMNQVLQDDLDDLKEQITLYESAVKHGVIQLDLNRDWENHMSQSYVDLGIKEKNVKNVRAHSTPMACLPDPTQPRDEAVMELKAELQRSLACLKGKRQKISQLQEELRHSQRQLEQRQLEQLEQVQLEQVQLDQAQVTTVRGAASEKLPDSTSLQKEVLRLQEERQRLLEHVQLLEKKNQELRQREEKVRAANTELCSKMREMIQELDQEKQEAAERYERTHLQFRDDVVNKLRAELTQEHAAQIQQLTAHHQLQIQQLQCKLSEVSAEIASVQECYISVCREKTTLEDKQSRCEAELRENELRIREESGTALEELRAELERQHHTAMAQLEAQLQAQLQAGWSADTERRIQDQVSSAKAAWQDEQEERERAWAQRLEEAREEARVQPHRDSREEASQTEGGASPESFSRQELEDRLRAERLRLLQEAEADKHTAVEETQRDLREKHLEDMSRQVEGAVTRAYSRWLEDLTSLPEYKANLQRERAKWDERQEEHIQEQVSLALRVAEEQQRQVLASKEQGPGRQQVENLQEKLVSLQSQLERVKREEATLLKAELAGAKAVWNRDKQQEMSSLQSRHELERDALIQEQRVTLEQAVQQAVQQAVERAVQRAREDAEDHRKQLGLQNEEELRKALRDRQEEWRAQQEDLRRQVREESLLELQAGLAEAQDLLIREAQDLLLREAQTQPLSRDGQDGCSPQEGSVRHILQSACREMISRAVGQAKKEWERRSEIRLAGVLKDAQQSHEREVNQIHNTVAQKRQEGRCGKQCAETVAKLRKKNHEVQKHLEKACRQLQLTVRENKTTVQRLTDEHEARMRQVKEQHLQELEQNKQTQESSLRSGRSSDPQNVQAGLAEMKEQYMNAVGKIRGDMLRYLQDSKERASEMIRVEVLRERRDTARKMRQYYLTCLHELLEESGQGAGAEKKIINAARKLAAMAKALETPTKKNPARCPSMQRSSSNSDATVENDRGGVSSSGSKHSSPEASGSETRCEKWTVESQTNKTEAATSRRTKPTGKAVHQDLLTRGKLKDAASKAHIPPAQQPSLQPAPQARQPSLQPAPQARQPSLQPAPQARQPSFQPAPLGGQASLEEFLHRGLTEANVTLRKPSPEVYLQGVDTGQADNPQVSQRTPSLIQETPVRDDGQSDWSLDSNAKHEDSFVPVPSYPFAGSEPFLPLSMFSSDLREFGGLTTDHSDMTVYKEIASMPSSHSKTLMPLSVMGRTHREAVPGSKTDKQAPLISKSLFPEHNLCQQDSGFDSPYTLRK